MTDKLTPKETLDYFNKRIKLGQCGNSTTQRKAFEAAIEALEKQIPKRVEIADDYEELLCPCCGIDLMGSLSELDHDPYYCFECGQAIEHID